MHVVAKDVAHSVICLSVCLSVSVGHDCEHCKNTELIALQFWRGRQNVWSEVNTIHLDAVYHITMHFRGSKEQQ